jgi:signal transduction histidine kinase
VSRNGLFVLVFGGVVALSLAIAYYFVPHYQSLEAFRVQPAHIERIAHYNQTTYKWSFASTTAAPTDLVLYIPVHAGRLQVDVNGHDFGPITPHDSARISRRKLPTALTIAGQFLSDGKPNTIRITQMDNDIREAPNPIYLGPATDFAPVVADHFAIGPPMRASIPTMAIMMVLLTLVMAFLSRSPVRYLCMFGMFALQAMLELDDQIGWGNFSLRSVAPFLSLYRDLLLFICFNLWFDGSAAHRRIAFWVAAITTAILLVADIIDGLGGITFSLFVARALAVSGYCSYAVLNAQSVKIRSQKIALALFSVFMTSNLTYLFFFQPTGRAELDFLAANYVNVSMVLALTLLVFGAMALEWTRYRSALVDRNSLRAIMSGNRMALDQRTRELQEEIEKRAVLEERERFTRDLHDGISGQLLSLLLQARKGTLDPKEVERGVSQSLADLRLVTASLDTADEGLAASLRSFRERASQQLAIAGVALDWQEDDALDAITETSQTTLDILRIMQEAVTNIIRHAGAQAVSISARNAGTALTITITDNGCGIAETPSHAGNGLKNMHRRAERNGGALTIATGADGKGTMLTLVIPKKTINPSA